MKKYFFKSIAFIGLTAVMFTACLKDLNRNPPNKPTTGNIYGTYSDYIEVLAKLYTGLTESGQTGPAGNADLGGYDEGFSQYLREFWQLQELPTDEAVICWNDADIPDLHKMVWTSGNSFIHIMYDRIAYQIVLCNDFINHTSSSYLKQYNFTSSQLTTINQYRAEARFLKALSLYHGIDMFGNFPDITDETKYPGSSLPSNKNSRATIYNYIISELKAIDGQLLPPGAQYGHADQACEWALLANLYLNAGVYTGTPDWTDAITYCNKIINSGVYSLEPKYRNLFNTSNKTSKEVIFHLESNGINTKSYGATTYLVNAQIGGTMDAIALDSFGVTGDWAGLRTTNAFVAQFPDTVDSRYLFYKKGQTLSLYDTSSAAAKKITPAGYYGMTTFTDGYAFAKWRNVSSTGVLGSDPAHEFPDTDFPMFRLGEIYLIYAEAVLNGGSGGSTTQALNYLNALRLRAYGNSNNNIPALTMAALQNERARELEWEGHRRTDLIRWGLFTGSTYVWDWKGFVPNGQAVDAHFNVYPIPITDINLNQYLIQNPGYN